MRPAATALIGLFSLVLLGAGGAWAGSIIAVEAISFGNIVMDPDGDLIEIDASGGAASPHVYGSGRSFINGGNSGEIRVNSTTAGEVITLIFPGSVAVSDGSATHTIEGFSARSTSTPVISDGSGLMAFDIGGLLRLEAGQADSSYDFDITVTVQFDNP